MHIVSRLPNQIGNLILMHILLRFFCETLCVFCGENTI